MRSDYDIAVIGGGAGGLFASSVANALGAKVCMIEKTRLGGDCTWFGCMPSKAILKSGAVAHSLKESAKFGLAFPNVSSLDNSGVMSHVRDVVNEIATHHPAEVFEGRGIKVMFGPPQFVDERSVVVGEETIKAKRFVICTGSHPVVPPIAGLDSIDYLTNENVFDLEMPPEELIVLGGGPIGVEISQALSRLGAKVHLVEMLDRVLFREDVEVAQVLEDKLKSEGITILTGKKAVAFAKENGRVRATLEDKNGKREEISADNVLVAVGRAPNVEGLALDKAGVQYTNKGVEVNAYLQTTNSDIFACGDVVGPYLFSHVAAYQASVAVRNALFKRLAWQKVNYANITWATFTDPEVAHLGLTEEEAREKHQDVKVYKTEYPNVDRAITDVEKEGLIKIITNKKGHIIGAHAVGAQAGEIIQGCLIAKAHKIPLAKLVGVMFIYPTLSELVKKTAAKPFIEKADNPVVKFALKVMRTF
jgi:pyruvate/2-oxoglutarate dehydrogenase complex dihydrolipoamide dehydrogenase (E3) component